MGGGEGRETKKVNFVGAHWVNVLAHTLVERYKVIIIIIIITIIL